ncbi:hypothetical protein [Acinetobacter johnsonii]|uniref:hypothetical protein n=1 Tax=Acinetobacter johnsonii TaxID=40214 RepID=UPI0007385E10|nr:hypothetical protein [Acinetobacter johnsonii]AXF45003.1 hypothetical protein DT536_10045 [Acinetobacter johnsonii]KUG38313.1 hypothetical protein AAU60_10625 [Acinetobacter johnsonii]MDH1714696.1 hypothetical protein [Acinetobacter johnsonii]
MGKVEKKPSTDHTQSFKNKNWAKNNNKQKLSEKAKVTGEHFGFFFVQDICFKQKKGTELLVTQFLSRVKPKISDTK